MTLRGDGATRRFCVFIWGGEISEVLGGTDKKC